MIRCQHCGKKIGLLAVRYTWLDKENKIAIHDECIKEYEKKKLEKTVEPKMKLDEQGKQQMEEKSRVKNVENKEEILGVINAITEGIASKYCALYFTSNRIIVAKTGGSQNIWVLALGLIGAGIAGYNAKKCAGELKHFSPEDILKADKKNFDIAYSEINKIEMKRRRLGGGSLIRVSTNKNKHVFLTQEKDSKKGYNDYVNLVKSVLSNKLSDDYYELSFFSNDRGWI